VEKVGKAGYFEKEKKQDKKERRLSSSRGEAGGSYTSA
jgi:hypothetical protein